MEPSKPKSRDPKDFVINKLPDFTDVTILNTPLPQASSTVDRRSLLQKKTRRSNLEEQNNKHRQLNFDYSNVSQNSAESSLGIIQNISSLLDENTLQDLRSKMDYSQQERELACKALRKCNTPFVNGYTKPEKENNVNSSNLAETFTYNHLSNNKNGQPVQTNQVQSKPGLRDNDDKSISSSSVIFEPTEISARSSELNKTPEKSEPFPIENFGGISFNSNLGDMMAQFADEDFMSASKAASLMLADEVSWRKNNLASLPISEKERLELSCFSGVIGNSDLTVDGGRVSIGEFFKNKCGGMGHLSIATAVSDRPSFGLDTKSPQKQGRLRPLVDETVTTEASYNLEEKDSKTADCTKDPSVMSLSAIAHLLQELDSATPIKLVDQIMNANKNKRKQKILNGNPAGDTYTLLPANNRISLPISTNTTLSNEKPERDITAQNSFGHKFSLDSKDIGILDNKSYNELLNEATFLNPKLKKLLEMDNDDVLEETNENNVDDSSSIQQNQTMGLNTSIPRAESSIMPPPRKLSQLSSTHKKFMNSTTINESSLIHDTGPSDVSDPTLRKNDMSKETTLINSPMKNQSFETRKVEIGKNTQELCTCLVGIPREADFELYNGTDRWILCSLKHHDIQGEENNIEFSLPDKDILIEPDARKSFKIGVKMLRMGKLTVANFNIPCSDMVTRTSWDMKHLMCFVPEEPNIKVSTLSEDKTMDFQTITEDTSRSLPITLENKNSIDVPILLHLNQDKHLFSIGDSLLDDTSSLTCKQKESVCLILKPRQPLTVNINFRGMSLQSFGDKVLQKGVYNTEAKLKASICFKEGEEYVIKELLIKGAVGCCKLDILDTQFPLRLQPRIVRMINLKNTGSIAVSATVDLVQSKEDQSESRDFFICPNNIVLNGGEQLMLQISYKPENNKTDIEKHAMIRIIVGNKVSFYHIIGERALEGEQFSSDSFHQLQRSETPQRLRSISSPTSPHSLIFNRSGTSGRHSPGSTVSGGIMTETSMPLRATYTALVWGSVKTGKSDTKQFTILNTSNNKIKLLVTINSKNQNFKFLKDRHSVASVMTLSLQGMERKKLFVVFTPNFPNAASGEIIFSHYSSMRENRQPSGCVKIIQLFGYGGYGKIEITEAVKDTSGQMWLSLGKLNAEGILHAKMRLHNTGDLTCFAKVKLIPKALNPSVVSSWYIEPTELLLGPNQIQWVSLEFRPKKGDLITIHQEGVIHVGTLKITHGDEPTRLRIRRLYKKLKKSGELYDKVDEEADDFKELIRQISKAFPGEVFTQDLKSIGDSVQNLGDLCKGIVQNEVKLTIEIHADETISMLQDNMDDSQLFYSLRSDQDDESHFGRESCLSD